MTHERIHDLTDPRLDVYRHVKSRNAERDAKQFVAEGPTVVERLLRSDFQVCSVLITDRKFAGFEERLPQDVPVFRITDDQARELIGFEFHTGIIACAERRPEVVIDKLIPASGSSLLVAGDRITDPENVGAIVRIASAFGADAVMFGPGSADPFSRRVLRVSMGNVLFMPILEPRNFAASLTDLHRDHDFDVCATVLDAAAAPLSNVRFTGRTVLLFGNEYEGVSPSVLASATRLITIPMLNGTDSLNVAIAAGIVLHQYRCQSAAT